MPTWLWWLLGIPLFAIAASIVGPALLGFVILLAEAGVYLICRVLTAGSAEHEAIMKGHPSRGHLAGRHRPLRRWALRCQICFQEHEEQLRQEREEQRRQARGDST